MSKIEAIHHEAKVAKVTDRVVNGKHTTRYIVLENEDNYVKELAIEIYGDKCDEVDNINAGDLVKVSFNLASREWEGKYYSIFKFWKVEKLEGGQPAATEESKDLPF
jgi:hypothetical protein